MANEKYKIGWKDRGGMRHYITVDTKSEMLAEVADKTCFSDHVSVKVIHDRLNAQLEKLDKKYGIE